ncbi:hypothetical protein GCM10020220_113060 [Nonomuraea rubra]
MAVDGPAGSGKTTFAGRLGAELGCQVIHSDDFPVPWEEGPGGWFHALESQVLAPLQRGLPGGFRRYDWVRGRYAGRVAVPVAPVLVVEGVGTARASVAHLLAYSVWVEAAEPVRLRRGAGAGRRRAGAAVAGVVRGGAEVVRRGPHPGAGRRRGHDVRCVKPVKLTSFTT